MSDPLDLLPRAWWSFSLPGYREHPQPATYSQFPLEDLPRIHVPADPQFHWLLDQPDHDEWSLADNPYPYGSLPYLTRFPHLADNANVPLPVSFSAFIRDRRLHRRIRSCTACLLDLGDYFVTTTKPLEGTLLRFLSDQQSCLHWCLFTLSSGLHCVLVTAEPWGLFYSPDEPPQSGLNLTQQQVWLCAYSFEEFIYGFWLENEIWFRVLRDKLPATPEEAAYLNHYRRLAAHEGFG